MLTVHLRPGFYRCELQSFPHMRLYKGSMNNDGGVEWHISLARAHTFWGFLCKEGVVAEEQLSSGVTPTCSPGVRLTCSLSSEGFT